MEPTAALARYVATWHSLTPAVVDRLDEVFTTDARFADPFSDVRGLTELRRVFSNMFERCHGIRLTVSESAVVGDVGLMHWEMRFRPASDPTGPEWTITGMSRVTFAADGRVAEHVDHWDAASQVYLRIPVLGALMRWLRHRLG